MAMIDWLILGLIALGVAASRFVPGMIVRTNGRDAQVYLDFRDVIRENGHRPPARMERYIFDRHFSLPWLFPWALSFLPAGFPNRFPPAASALCDGLHAFLVGALAVVLTATDDRLPIAPVAFLAALLFGLTPGLVAMGIGPRAYEMTPRPWGELWFTGVMGCTMLAITLAQPWWWLPAALSGGLLLLTGRFPAQVLIFSVPLVALVTLDPVVLLVLPLSVGAALLLTGGGYWWILLGHLHLAVIYRRYVEMGTSWFSDRNNLGDLARAVGGTVRGNRAAARRIPSLLEQNTPFQYLVRFPQSLLLLIFLLAGGAAILPQGAWVAFAVGWAFVTLVPFVLTSLPGLRFLGEAERYPEYSAPPVALLLAWVLLLFTPALVLPVVLASAVFFALHVAYASVRRALALRRTDAHNRLEDLATALREDGPETVVLTFPIQESTALASVPRVRFAYGHDFGSLGPVFHDLVAVHPWPNPDLAWWRDTHGVTLLCVNLAVMDGDPRAPAYDFSGWEESPAPEGFRFYRARVPVGAVPDTGP